MVLLAKVKYRAARGSGASTLCLCEKLFQNAVRMQNCPHSSSITSQDITLRLKSFLTMRHRNIDKSLILNEKLVKQKRHFSYV
uniref:Uncharacterized protein n=1 Tax=Romanomermis culicivorax TaxID=13658 RepID=A0A915HW57_ROMCU